MNVSISTICTLVANLYDDKIASDPVQWDSLCTVDGSYSALKRVDGTDVLVWRGSTSQKDWLEDFDNLAIPISDPEIGGVHPGFLSGVRTVQDRWDGELGNGPVICGHSLGAGHAWVYAAHLCAIGRPPSLIAVFGSPRPGFQKLADLVKAVPAWSYRNQANTKALTSAMMAKPPVGKDGALLPQHDLVTDVPFYSWPMFLYVEPREFTPVCAPPPPDDPWSVFAWHHFALYAKGVAALG